MIEEKNVEIKAGLPRVRINAAVAHRLPLSLYITVFFILVGLTVLTVALAGVDFGPFQMAITLFIAAVKASLVLAIFMHLWWDSKFYTFMIACTVICLALFVLFPVLDLGYREDLDEANRNFLPRDEKVFEHKKANPDALDLRPGLIKAKKDQLIFKNSSDH